METAAARGKAAGLGRAAGRARGEGLAKAVAAAWGVAAASGAAVEPGEVPSEALLAGGQQHRQVGMRPQYPPLRPRNRKRTGSRYSQRFARLCATAAAWE